MTKRGIFKITPVSTKTLGITATRPDPTAVRGFQAMRELVLAGSVKSSKPLN
jgi:hypothetical protein